MITQDLGIATAYGYAKSKGYTGTEVEFAELMASYAEVGQTAVDAAETATTKASEAATSATTATNKASEATTAATTATTKAGEASTSASTATSAKDTAVSASQTATTKATEATTAAATATSAATTATTAKDDAVSAKTAAQTAQTGAEAAAASVEASAEQIATNAEDISQLKSEFTALESDGVVPSAEQILTDKGITDSVPYHFRKTASDNADREELEIVGGSVAWNQLVPNSFVTITGTGTGAIEGPFDSTDRFSLVENHKYVVLFSGTIPTGTTFRIRDVAESIAKNLTSSTIYSATQNTSGTTFLQHTVTSGTSYSINRNVFDLTAMFGTTIADYIYQLEQTTAGAGVAFFKKLFPNDYYPYTTGELKSVSGLSEHKTVGFNQWDEEWENGRLNKTTGETGVGNGIRSKNFIRVMPNTEYYFRKIYANYFGASSVVYAYYDKNKTFISGGETSTFITFTTPSGAAYMKFAIPTSAEVVAYANDICINLSDPAKNDTYEPYKAHSYPLDSTVELRGWFKLDANNKLYADGDTYDADGTVTRRYVEHTYNGSENWQTSGSAYYINVTDIKNGTTPVLATYLHNSDWGSITQGTDDNAITAYKDSSWTNGRVGIRASAYATVADWKAHLQSNPLTVIYAVATPTTEQAQPFTNPQIVDGEGTEEYVTDSIVPVGHVTKYIENLKKKILDAPQSPTADGDYIVRQTDGTNEYVPLAPILDTKADVTDLLKAFPTDTASGSVASFADGANVPVKSLIVDINPVQEGSGDPSPDNVRPISGWTGAVVSVSGPNLFDKTKSTPNSAINSQGIVISGSYYVSDFIHVKPDTDYYIKNVEVSIHARSLCFYGVDKSFISAESVSGGDSVHAASFSKHIPSNVYYIRIMAHPDYIDSAGVNYPSTDTDYHPYSGQSITIALGQTVYGGKLDVTNGVLTIVDGLLTKNTAEMNNAEDFPGWQSSGVRALVGGGQNAAYRNQILNVGTAFSVNTVGAYDILYLPRTGESSYGMTQTEWKALAIDVQVVVPLATPLTIQLTPHEVTALLGFNNVWADSGNTEVTYRADPTLYIQRLTEPDADMVADANITSGQYFMVGNTLYKATANIASGATISPNVNCTRKSLSEALNELNA